jgi:hypothetical protein
MNQKEIDALASACRSQGMTWAQTNFAVSLVRNKQSKERARFAELCRKAMPQPVKNLADSQVVDALRPLLEMTLSPADK